MRTGSTDQSGLTLLNSAFIIIPTKNHFSLTNYVLDCLGPSFPATFLVSLAPIAVNNTSSINVTEESPANRTRHVIRPVDPQDDLKSALSEMALPKIVKLDIPVEDEDADEEGKTRVIKAKVYLPTSLRAANQIKYPLLLHV